MSWKSKKYIFFTTLNEHIFDVYYAMLCVNVIFLTKNKTRIDINA